MSNKDKSDEEFTGCALLFLFIVVCMFAGIPVLCYYENKEYEELVVDNRLLLSQSFEVKEIFTERRGSKPANYHVVRECIVENTETKERLRARFNDNTLPLIGDTWKIQKGEQPDNRGYKGYMLYEKVK